MNDEERKKFWQGKVTKAKSEKDWSYRVYISANEILKDPDRWNRNALLNILSIIAYAAPESIESGIKEINEKKEQKMAEDMIKDIEQYLEEMSKPETESND